MLQLSDSTLTQLPRRLHPPTYDRSTLRPSILHIGVGGFHRAHQAVYLDELARNGHSGWGEVGVSLRTPDLRATLAQQDGLFSVVEMSPGRIEARVVGVMTDYLFGPAHVRKVLDRLAHPDTRIVTLTVTGDGYGPGQAEGAVCLGPESSWTDYVVAGLAQRRTLGLGGLTVLSCDNIADSGSAARAALLSRAAKRDETLALWIDRNVTFPDSMVDRITPGTGPDVRALVARKFGLSDQAPVATEPFRQWVVQDEFCQGRPPLEDVGVQMVADVAPYKLVKSRLLNGTHTAMAYLGRLAGYRTTADTVADPVMRAFVTQLMRDEVAPLLPTVPGMDIAHYADIVVQRLSNASVADPLDRLCRRGSTKVPAYLLPSLSDASRRGLHTPLLALALAGWFRYLHGSDEAGRPIEIEDARLAELQPRARRCASDPAPLLGWRDILGPVSADPLLGLEVRSALVDLEGGVASAVAQRLAGVTKPSSVVSLASRRRAPKAHADLIS